MNRVWIAILATVCFSNLALANEKLAGAKNCLGCHAVGTQVVGPSFKDVAKKYKGNNEAATTLAAKIRAGGGGVWGAIPMPANPQVSEAEAKKLTSWILGLK
ncbi:MAG: c-type cytochrome [Limnohabitans sp.]